MIVEILVTQGQPVDALAQQVQHRMFDQLFIPMVGEALGKALNISIGSIQSPQQHAASVAGNLAALKIHRHRFAADQLWKKQGLSVTVCPRSGVGLASNKVFHNNFMTAPGSTLFVLSVRNPG
jgi:hypothetical protein